MGLVNTHIYPQVYLYEQICGVGSNVKVEPGISDHMAVLFNINMSPKVQTMPRKTIYEYGKADQNQIKNYLNSQLTEYQNRNLDSLPIEDN